MSKRLVVGDVGSTKSTWWFNTGVDYEVPLPGFNPLVHNPEVGEALVQSLSELVKDFRPDDIWYYGAGITDSVQAGDVIQMLKKSFSGSTIHVASDLEGAVLAACGQEPGTVAILGTGSHAAVYDGQKITRKAEALGYILGDEGGGCDLGKELLRAYFYHDLPDVIAREMEVMLPEGKTGLLNNLKSSPVPNRYLADFARVAVLFQDHPWVTEMVGSRFALFIKRHIVPIHALGPVHIVGSIGCIFAGLIQKELEKHHLSSGEFIRDPAYRLFALHMGYERE